MKKQIQDQELVARRSEIMAELLLQDLHPAFVARSESSDFGVDFFVGFLNPKGGMNIVAVEVKSTGNPAPSTFKISRRAHNLLTNSNIPGLLLVINTKLNRHYYAEPTQNDEGGEMVTIPITEATGNSWASLARRLSGLP
ncbi:DUF4365 domain-containing protein [Corallococcus sp. 4LFB]|uniref:DUF4365 domain-containing protein n=1 Tax=Corallococcus sp. 4LFB TaxID=3383249 RepID=UPI003974E9B3